MSDSSAWATLANAPDQYSLVRSSLTSCGRCSSRLGLSIARWMPSFCQLALHARWRTHVLNHADRLPVSVTDPGHLDHRPAHQSSEQPRLRLVPHGACPSRQGQERLCGSVNSHGGLYETFEAAIFLRAALDSRAVGMLQGLLNSSMIMFITSFMYLADLSSLSCAVRLGEKRKPER